MVKNGCFLENLLYKDLYYPLLLHIEYFVVQLIFTSILS